MRKKHYSKGKKCKDCGKKITNKAKRCGSCARKGENNPIKRPEVRNKKSVSMKGENNPMFGLYGENNPNYGSRRSEETKRKMSEAKKGENHPFYGKKNPEHSKKMKGKKNPNWNGGSSKFPYAPDWAPKVKRKVLERDNHLCQNCGELENLAVHHINYDKMNCDSTNLITLCISCNSRSNRNRKDWQKIYEGIINGQRKKSVKSNHKNLPQGP